ncbi:MAG: 6-phospho-3-hexuloisomerase [Thermodesulfobacteriota bacterium]
MKSMINDCLEYVQKENRKLLSKIDVAEAAVFIECLNSAPTLFFSAQGRSGYILRAFCMRLMHLGYNCHFVGETITPPIKKGDLLVVLSGSGETVLPCEAVKIAKKVGALTYAILGDEASPLAGLSDRRLVLPGGTKRQRDKEMLSGQPPGSLFEQSAFLFLEAIILAIYREEGSNYRILLARHANLE